MQTLFHWLLAFGMLITGSINTLSTKWADKLPSKNADGTVSKFNHPFVQAIGMFLGEFSCLIVFFLLKLRARMTNSKVVDNSKNFNPLILALPATCDMTATSLMYLGLTLTEASTFQMLRGCVVIFTGLFSVWFLGRRLYAYNWVGMALVLVGTTLVGVSSYACGADETAGPMKYAYVGNIIIIIAQIVVAVQMVVEERFIGGYNIPALKVVGLEGLWGAIMLSIVVAIMYKIPRPAFMCSAGDDCSHFADAPNAFAQIGNNGLLLFAVLLNMSSIAGFNWFGISVTKHLNASTRMVLDSIRTVVIWAFSMALKWQSFCYLQVIGFLVLLTGTIIYNRIGYDVPYLPYPSLEEEEAERARMEEVHRTAFTHAEDGEKEQGLLDHDQLAPSLEAGEGVSIQASSVSADSPAFENRGMNDVQTPTLGRAAFLKSK